MGLENEPIELFIDLGRACNISCGHCLNKSGPTHSVIDLSISEISAIVASTNSNSSIATLHFSGGEPTLYRNSILEIQKKVTRPIKYTMTTNGTLGENLSTWLSGIKMNRIHLSIDRWHQKQVTNETLIRFIQTAQENLIELEIEAVMESVLDIAEYRWLAKYNLEVQPRFLLASGRSKSNSLGINLEKNDKCPTFQNSRAVKKINWFRGKGFSYCCGPLVFNQQQNDEFLYSRSIEGLPHTPLSQFLESQSIQGHLSFLGFKTKRFSGPCDACSFLNKKRDDLGFLSLAEILTSKQRYFRISSQIKESTWRDLGNDFKFTYLLYNESPENIPRNYFESRSLEEMAITRKPVREYGMEGLLSFLKVNFYDKWKEFRSNIDFERVVQGTPSYYSKDLQGFWYLKNDQIVALLVFSRENNHPAVNKDVIHIGHWGYLPQYLNKEEIRSIKNNWIEELLSFSELNGWLPLDGVVDDFNSASLGLANKLGFKIHSFRIDKRGVD